MAVALKVEKIQLWPVRHYRESSRAIVTVKLSWELNDRLEEYAARHGLTKSDVIRQALKQFLDRVGT